MPRLKIPEKIDMAIDVASLGAKRMVLSWQLQRVGLSLQSLYPISEDSPVRAEGDDQTDRVYHCGIIVRKQNRRNDNKT